MKNLVKLVFVIYALSVTMLSHAASVDMSVSPQPKDVIGLNQIFTLDIVGIFNSDGGEVLVGGALDLVYDSSIISVNSVTLNSPVDIGSSLGTIDNVGGSIDTIGFASFAGVADGAFNLATVEFESVGFGTSALMLQNANDLVFEWANELGDSVNFAAIDGSVRVVPLPASAWLLISGIIGLVSIVRRKTS